MLEPPTYVPRHRHAYSRSLNKSGISRARCSAAQRGMRDWRSGMCPDKACPRHHASAYAWVGARHRAQ